MVSRSCFRWGFLAVLAVGTLQASASPFTYTETFGDDPIANGRADAVIQSGPDASRFTYTGSGVTAHYDSGQETAMMRWKLPGTLDQTQNFTYRVSFTLSNFLPRSPVRTDTATAPPLPPPPGTSLEGRGQIAFGLINTQGPVNQQTGFNRDSGPTFDGTLGTSYNIVTTDYYPSSIPPKRTLGETVYQSDNGTGFFGRLKFPFTNETMLGDAGEIAGLPAAIRLLVVANYDAGTQMLSLRIFDGTTDPFGLDETTGTALAINQPAAPGADPTIVNSLGLANFSVDTFALTLWRAFPDEQGEIDFLGGILEDTIGDVTFNSFSVTAPAPVPEPSHLLFPAIVAAAAWMSRRRILRITSEGAGT